MARKTDKPATPISIRRRFRERLLLTLGLGRKPLKFFCEYCGKFIPSDMAWVCGYCNTENTRTNRFSFLNRCERCKSAPKSFACPNCDEIIYFGKPHDDKHVARKSGYSKPPPLLVTAPSGEQLDKYVRARRIQEREDRKSELEYEIVCARLDNDLARLKRQRETPKKKTPREALEEDFSHHDEHFMAVNKIASEKLKAYQKQYADDPDLLELATLSVERWKMLHT